MNNVVLDKKVALTYNPIVLAYVGDAVQTLFVRSNLAVGSDCKTGELHKRANRIVCATHQSKVAESILPDLTDEERDVFFRARNAHVNSVAKHADIIDYKKASGLEAVFGFLYLTGQYDRLQQLLEFGEKE